MSMSGACFKRTLLPYKENEELILARAKKYQPLMSQVPIMSFFLFRSCNSTFHLMNFCEKNFDSDKTQLFCEFLESSKFYFLPVEPRR